MTPLGITNMTMKLYVGNLSFDTTENELEEYFGSFGEVQEAALVQDRNTGNSRGFGFVTMKSREDAENAIQELHGKPFNGRNLTVNEAKPKTEFSGGGGGRNRQFRGGGGGNRY